MKFRIVEEFTQEDKYNKILKLEENYQNSELSGEYDNEGNKLSPEQIKFFKNSKIRDEQGRLLVCYHRSESNFETFDSSYFGQD